METRTKLGDFPFLTRDEFEHCIERFRAQYTTANSRLDIGTASGSFGRQYLTIGQTLAQAACAERSIDIDIDEVGGSLEDPDPLEQHRQRDGHSFRAQGLVVEYHVVFSRSWRVPVVYVRVLNEAQETVLDVGRVYDLLVGGDPVMREAMQSVEFGGALGIQDHPELGTPYLYLHPCHTATLLRAVAAAPDVEIDSRNYLSAFLSLVGPAVGLTLPAIADPAAGGAIARA
ncbi:hypothetical protein GGF46_001724 [Coemansia sp. RSA 552]|nr:hypothetical protein GGF46_001724 [Coemansia sp. RSA 552]